MLPVLRQRHPPVSVEFYSQGWRVMRRLEEASQAEMMRSRASDRPERRGTHQNIRERGATEVLQYLHPRQGDGSGKTRRTASWRCCGYSEGCYWDWRLSPACSTSWWRSICRRIWLSPRLTVTQSAIPAPTTASMRRCWRILMIEAEIGNLLGGVEFDLADEVVEILRDVMPPSYHPGADRGQHKPVHRISARGKGRAGDLSPG